MCIHVSPDHTGTLSVTCHPHTHLNRPTTEKRAHCNACMQVQYLFMQALQVSYEPTAYFDENAVHLVCLAGVPNTFLAITGDVLGFTQGGDAIRFNDVVIDEQGSVWHAKVRCSRACLCHACG